MRARAQSYLPGLNLRSVSRSHGGEFARHKRKIARPVDPKQALHVVMRSSVARGGQSMLDPRHSNRIHHLIHACAKRLGVRLYRFANVGNHLHLLIQVPSRTAWRRFSREISGGIAQIVTGATKGSALPKNQTTRGFWDHLMFTRIVNFGRDFAGVGRYLVKNLFEAAGVPMKKLLARGIRVMSMYGDGRLPDEPTLLR